MRQKIEKVHKNGHFLGTVNNAKLTFILSSREAESVDLGLLDFLPEHERNIFHQQRFYKD